MTHTQRKMPVMIGELARLRSRVEKLSQEIKDRLASAHTEYGFKTRQEFIAALHALGATAAKTPTASRKRHRLTHAAHEKIKKAIAGGATAGQISKTFKISWPAAQYHVKAFQKAAKLKPAPAPKVKQIARKKPVAAPAPKPAATSSKA